MSIKNYTPLGKGTNSNGHDVELYWFAGDIEVSCHYDSVLVPLDALLETVSKICDLAGIPGPHSAKCQELLDNIQDEHDRLTGCASKARAVKKVCL